MVGCSPGRIEGGYLSYASADDQQYNMSEEGNFMSLLRSQPILVLLSCLISCLQSADAERTITMAEVGDNCISIQEQKLLNEITSPARLADLSLSRELAKRYSEYREKVKRVILLEEELKKEKGDLFELELPKNLLWQRRNSGYLSSEQELRKLVIPGAAYIGRERLKKLIGIQNIAKVDEFLNVSKKTIHLIETGKRSTEIGAQTSPAPLPTFLKGLD